MSKKAQTGRFPWHEEHNSGDINDELESKVSDLTTAVEELKETVGEQTTEIKRLQEKIDKAQADQPGN